MNQNNISITRTNIEISLQVLVSENGDKQLVFFKISKKDANIKAVYVQGHDEFKDYCQKYGPTNRLVKIMAQGDDQREACISPQAPFAQQLQANRNLTIGGKKVTQVTLMTKDEYDDFVVSFTQSGLKAINELSNQKKAKTATTTQAPVAEKTSSQPVKKMTATAVVVIGKQSLNQMILRMIEKQWEANRAEAERDYEAYMKTLDLQIFLKKRQENSSAVITAVARTIEQNTLAINAHFASKAVAAA